MSATPLAIRRKYNDNICTFNFFTLYAANQKSNLHKNIRCLRVILMLMRSGKGRKSLDIIPETFLQPEWNTKESGGREKKEKQSDNVKYS